MAALTWLAPVLYWLIIDRPLAPMARRKTAKR